MKVPNHLQVSQPDQDSINGVICLWVSRTLEQPFSVKWIQYFGEHLEHLRQVFEQFRKFGLLVKMSKCEFCMDRMDFLGHEVSAEGLRPNANKVRAINAMPTPTDA